MRKTSCNNKAYGTNSTVRAGKLQISLTRTIFFPDTRGAQGLLQVSRLEQKWEPFQSSCFTFFECDSGAVLLQEEVNGVTVLRVDTGQLLL